MIYKAGLQSMHITYGWFTQKWRDHAVNTAFAIRICVSLFILFSFTKVNGQTVSNSVFGTTGGTATVSGLTADWSIGGTAFTSTMVLPNGQVLTQGFLQPADTVALTLTFNALPVKTYGDPDFVLTADAGNGVSITYVSNDQTVAQIVNGDFVKIVGAGTANITATISGTAISIVQPLVVNKASQVITFDLIPVLYLEDTLYIMHASSNKGLPVTYTSSNGVVAKINGNNLVLLDLGKTTVTASAGGNANYLPAASISQLVQVISRTGEQIKVPLVMTPNGDGINDDLVFKGIQNYPINSLVIANRNGVKIYENKNITSDIILIDRPGELGSRAIIGNHLPQGTYFYSLTFKDGNTNRVKTGWFVIKY